MLSLDDEKWRHFDGGYRIPYDASVALRSMRDGMTVWDELWEELHHQGDVGIASYAAIPQMVRIAAGLAYRDWNFYGLVAIIDIERHRQCNPAMPAWLKADYDDALAAAASLALSDLETNAGAESTRMMLALLALSKGELKLGALLSGLESGELDDWLEERMGWSELYERGNAVDRD